MRRKRHPGSLLGRPLCTGSLWHTGVSFRWERMGGASLSSPLVSPSLRHMTSSTRIFLKNHLTQLPNIAGVQIRVDPPIPVHTGHPYQAQEKQLFCCFPGPCLGGRIQYRGLLGSPSAAGSFSCYPHRDGPDSGPSPATPSGRTSPSAVPLLFHLTLSRLFPCPYMYFWNHLKSFWNS